MTPFIAALALLTCRASADSLDRRWFDAIHNDLRSPALDATTSVVNEFGDSFYIIGGSVGAIVLGGSKLSAAGKLALAGFGFSALATEVLKGEIGRPRPLNPEDKRSMPSGHATNAFAVATALSSQYPRRSLTFYTLAAGVAFCRVYKGRHYPSDVLVGAVIGVVATRLVLTQKTHILSLSF